MMGWLTVAVREEANGLPQTPSLPNVRWLKAASMYYTVYSTVL